MRRAVRPYFVDTRWKAVYDVITWLFTHIAVYYLMSGFIVLHLSDTIRFYKWVLLFPGQKAKILPILYHEPLSKTFSQHDPVFSPLPWPDRLFYFVILLLTLLVTSSGHILKCITFMFKALLETFPRQIYKNLLAEKAELELCLY